MKHVIKNNFRAGILIFCFSLCQNAWSEGAILNNTEPPEPWQDNFQDITYSATSYDWVTVTIEFGLDKPLSRTVEINARDGKPTIENDNLKEDIEALLALGVIYIDIGFNTDRMAAEVPFAHLNVDKLLAEKILPNIINIYDQLK